MMDTSKYLNPPADACPTCDGCGAIANDDERSPWWRWESLPEPAKLAIHIGMVQRVTCPDCHGTGKKEAQS